MEEVKRGMENQLRAHPKDIAAIYKEKIKEMKAVIGELTLENIAFLWREATLSSRKKYDALDSERRNDADIKRLRQDGHHVTVTQLSHWFGIPRRTLYYHPKKRTPKLDEDRVRKVKEKMEEFPTYGYRRLALLTGINKKAVQRILQIKGWQVRKRQKGQRPRAKAMPSRTITPDTRWAIDMTRVWCGKDCWSTLAAVIDTCTREIVGFRLPKSAKAKTAEAALQEGLIYRFGKLQRLQKPITLRSDNGLVFSSKSFTKTVKDYRFQQEFITPYTPERPKNEVTTTPQRSEDKME